VERFTVSANQLEGKFPYRRRVGEKGSPIRWNFQEWRPKRRKIKDRKEFRHVDVFGGKSPPEYIIRIGHQFNPKPVNVAVELARGQIQGLQGL
jgi:hypothetical protein